jgi:hypothetical protein
MKRVTREFITLRQPKATWKMMVISGVDRSRIYDGETDCYDNVMREIKGQPDVMVCSGWLVGPYNSELDRTMIIPWWWNVRKTESGSVLHYDCTPYGDNSIEFEYIVDRDIIEYIKDPMNTLSSSIPDPIEYSGGVFYSVDQTKSEKTALGDLSLASIFYSQRRSIITLDQGTAVPNTRLGTLGLTGTINLQT